MKLLVFLLFLLPLWAEAQLMEPLDRWGIRTAYTHTNSSKSFAASALSSRLSVHEGSHRGIRWRCG